MSAVALRPQRFISAATGVESTRNQTENHRRQEAHGSLPVGREFGGDAARDRGHHVAETHDEEARKHGSEQSFVYFVYAHPRRNFGFQIFQSYVFFLKKRFRDTDYFPIAYLCSRQ